MKSGTTWLYENLRCHPQVFLTEQKELYYFSHSFHDGTLRYYAKRFAPGATKVRGEITPGYALVPLERIRFIKRVMPDVKLVFLARNPVSRSWSEAVMNLVVKPNRAMTDVTDDMFIRYVTRGDCPRRSDYVEILNRWLSVFAPEQLFIGTLDEVTTRPQQLLQRLFAFLQISADVDWRAFPFDKIIVPRYESNRMVYGGDVVGTRHGPEPLMPASVRAALTEIHAPQIEELEKRFALPIGHWQRSCEA